MTDREDPLTPAQARGAAVAAARALLDHDVAGFHAVAAVDPMALAMGMGAMWLAMAEAQFGSRDAIRAALESVLAGELE